MNGTMLIYKVGKREPEVRRFDHAPDLADLKEAIGGGSIEKVPMFHTIEHEGRVHRCIALVDEEGKLDYRTSGVKKDRPDETNNVATLLWHQALKREGHPGLLTPFGNAADWLVGQVCVIYGDREFMDEL